MTIHKEGRTLLFVLLIALAGMNWLFDYLMPQAVVMQQVALGISVVIYVLVLQFFRNPVFTVAKNDKYIYAPADGKVVVIEEAEEPEYLKSRRKQVSIFMSPVNVHVNRMPVGGRIR